MRKNKVENILLIKCRPIGDCIMGLSSINYLQEIFPDSKITYGVSERAFPVFRNYSKINTGFCSLDFSVKNWFRLYNFLNKNKFDLIIELIQRGSSEKFFRTYKLLNKTNYYYYDWRAKDKNFIIDQGIEKPAIQKDLDCIWSSMKQFTNNNNLKYPDYLNYTPKYYLSKPKKINKSFKVVIMGISAGIKAKIWPADYYKDLIIELNSIYKNLFFIIPLEPDIQGEKIGNKIKSWNISNIRILKAELSDIPFELSEGNYYIGNDTGLKHISVSLGMKTLTLFGEANPQIWHPYDTSVQKYIYKGNINNINLDDVIEAAKGLLD